MSTLRNLALAALALTSLALAAPRAIAQNPLNCPNPLVLDDFSTTSPSFVTTSPTFAFAAPTSGAGILGGIRQYAGRVPGGTNPVDVNVQSTFFNVNVGNFSSGDGRLEYYGTGTAVNAAGNPFLLNLNPYASFDGLYRSDAGAIITLELFNGATLIFTNNFTNSALTGTSTLTSLFSIPLPLNSGTLTSVTGVRVTLDGLNRETNDNRLQYIAFCPPTVPEPGTYAMLAAGVLSGGMMLRRRRKSA